jgi:hypothetical protein
LPSVAPSGKYSFWSAEGLLSTLGASRRMAGQWVCGGPVGLWCSGRYTNGLAGRWRPRGPVVWGWQPTSCFSVWWHGEAFQVLGVQGAEVSALPGALLPPSMTPVSQQSPWFMELTQSVSVSQLPFWILLKESPCNC